MDDEDIYEKPSHIDAIREAWHEYKESASFKAFCLHDPDPFEDGGGVPWVVAWPCAVLLAIPYRFTPLNLERLLRPQKAERRQRLDDLNQYVFICGAEEWGEERWHEVEALLAEFGGKIGVDFPPRDWKPYSAAETVGTIMGFTREEVAEIVAL